MTKSLVSALSAFVLLAAPMLAQAQDTVKLRNGTTETGRIEAENYDALQFKAKKGKDGKEEKMLKLPWSEVAGVEYSGAVEFNQAVNQLNSGNLAQAMPKLQSLVSGNTLRKELKPAAMFQLASALQRSGKFAEASAMMLELVKGNPKSRFLVPAIRAIVDCQLAAGDIAGGMTAVDAAIQAATEGGVENSYVLSFDLFRGLLLEAKKEAVTAKVKFQSAAGVSNGPTNLTNLAKLGLARCEQAEGKLDPARTAFRGLIDQQLGNEVMGGAWNSLADMSLADGVKAKKAEMITDALFMYLRSVVEFAPIQGESTGEYERGLAGAAQAFAKLAEVETDDTLKKGYVQKSKARLDQLKKEFPNSIYLPK